MRHSRLFLILVLFIILLSSTVYSSSNIVSDYKLKTFTVGEGNIIKLKGSENEDGYSRYFIKAKPDSDWHFDHWEGDYSGNTDTLEIVLNKNTVIIGVFKKVEFNNIHRVLNSPQEVVDFASDYFTVKFHDGPISYEPETFFELKHGDCKDFATFYSYILDKKDFYSKVLSYEIFFENGERRGHAFAIFRDKDGLFKMIIHEPGIIKGAYNSIEELKKSEEEKLEASVGKIKRKKWHILDAGSINMCPEK